MTADDIKTGAAIFGPLISLGSLTLNVYQFRQNNKLKRLPPVVERKAELRASLQAVTGRIASSFILESIHTMKIGSAVSPVWKPFVIYRKQQTLSSCTPPFHLQALRRLSTGSSRVR